MKKIINAPENYVDDMLKGIYAAHSDEVKYAADDLRCYCRAEKKDGKVAIITGGGSGHLPLFLGYVGDGLIDGCGVGGVFQSPSPEQIYNIAKEVEAGAGIGFAAQFVGVADFVKLCFAVGRASLVQMM